MRNLQKSAKEAIDKQKKFELPTLTSAAFYSNIQAHSLDPAVMSLNYNSNNSNDIIEQQKQVQRTKSVELQLVTERKNNFDKLEKDMTDLNQIFKDLAVIVQDQGEIIGKLEVKRNVSAKKTLV